MYSRTRSERDEERQEISVDLSLFSEPLLFSLGPLDLDPPGWRLGLSVSVGGRSVVGRSSVGRSVASRASRFAPPAAPRAFAGGFGS